MFVPTSGSFVSLFMDARTYACLAGVRFRRMVLSLGGWMHALSKQDHVSGITCHELEEPDRFLAVKVFIDV